jgi:DNA-binding beta-propeller fold protein YncE
MSDPDKCQAEASSVGRAATGRRSSDRVAWTVGAAVTLAAAMSPMLLATPASARTAPVPNTVIATVPVPNTPEFTSADPGRGVVWMSGPSQAVEIKESTHKIIRTVDLEAYPIAQTIDPVTGKLIQATTDGHVLLINEANGAQTEIPAASTTNTLGEGIGADTVTGNIYVTDQGPGNKPSTISEISQRTNSVIASIDNPNGAEAVAVNSSTGTVYVSTIWTQNRTVLAGSVLVIKEKTNKVTDTITNVGNLPYAMTLDPASGKLFAANYFQHSLAIINLKTNKVTDQVALPDGAADFPAADVVNGMVYVMDFDEGNLWVVSEKTKSLVATIALPDAAGGLAVDPTKALVFAGSESPGSGSLAIIQAAPPSR